MLYFLYYDRMIRTTAELVRQAADPVVHRTAVAVPVVRQTAVAVHMAEQVSGMHMTEPADG